ncbi:NAD(P)-binding protein [Lactarius akahatsu]|uniref:NAD(P)-binding protein n=1 Tax=Lactarius akahatsu TaxID=416441 RepID=A0AAD4L862_9AGAM|nr:NAD(P)-binding protein [Lactarius akahatsu]
MGGQLSLWQQSFPPKPQWGVNDIPDLTGKVILVTGKTGIGKETVKHLLAHNAKVYLAARSAQRANEAIAELKNETGKQAIFLQLDLSDISAVRKSAQEFLSKESQLHVLINNAGVMVPPKEQVTVQTYDMQFGTNVIGNYLSSSGHWLLTELLLPALFAATDASPSHEKARIVTGLDFDPLADGPTRTRYGELELYNKSKFGNVDVACELARRYGDKIVSTSLNPGNIRTELQRSMPGWQSTIVNRIMYPPSKGALTQLYCVTAPSAVDANGKFFIPWALASRTRPL